MRSASGAPRVEGSFASCSGSEKSDLSMSLLCRFVEDEGGRDRDVERFDRLPHGNRETLVGLRNSVGKKSWTLTAEHDGDWAR